MTARVYYLHPDGTVEVTDRVARTGWEVKESAEEGVTPISTLVIDDPDMDAGFDGHRAFAILEDESEIDDDVLFYGWTWSQTVGRVQGDRKAPLARAWSVEVTDRNAFWQRRVMVGADCDRPAETDVERIQWLLSTSEASLFDDVTTYVSTADPIAMDQTDYRGQMFAQVIDDCAQASGKNWYAWVEHTGSARDFFAWYGHDSLTTRSSTLRLSNDPADMLISEIDDGTSLVWPISDDTVLRRDPSRTFSGCYLAFDGGAVYRYNAATAAAFAKRDFVAPSANVKTNAKAGARATRYLNELDGQDERITTSVELPKGKATMIRAGMRLLFKATHLPNYETYRWMRVLSCTISPISAGQWYKLTLELQGPGSLYVPPPVESSAFAVLYQPDNRDEVLGTRPNGLVHFGSDGDNPSPGYDSAPLTGALAYVEDTVSSTTGDWHGISSTGTGTLHAVFKADIVGVWSAGQVDFVFAIEVNDVVVLSVTESRFPATLTYVSAEGLVEGDLSVVPGDVISTSITYDRNGSFETVPGGTGNITFRLELSGLLA